jgi:hypothetical protein
MSVRLIPVTGKRELKRFIYLPEVLHRDHPMWMPNLYMDEWDYFDPKKNRAFGYCDTTLMLAEKDGELVGRVMGIINHRHNAAVKERTGRFALLESTRDQEVVHTLLAHVEEWAKAKGMTKVIGPFGFTDQDPEGFQIEGFEHHPTIVTYYNFPWLIPMLEQEGYGKETDYVVYKVPAPKAIPELMTKLAERVERRGFREVGLRKKSEVKRYIVPVLRLMNEAYQGIYGYSPLDELEMEDLAKKYLAFLDIRFLRIVVKGEEVVGFMVAMPDLHQAFVKSRGRLLPFGWIPFLRELKRRRFKQLDLLLAGVKQEHRGKGLEMLFGREMAKAIIAAGVEVLDSHHELETNTLVRAEMERQGGQIYKRYRIFRKGL